MLHSHHNAPNLHIDQKCSTLKKSATTLTIPLATMPSPFTNCPQPAHCTPATTCWQHAHPAYSPNPYPMPQPPFAPKPHTAVQATHSPQILHYPPVTTPATKAPHFSSATICPQILHCTPATIHLLNPTLPQSQHTVPQPPYVPQTLHCTSATTHLLNPTLPPSHHIVHQPPYTPKPYTLSQPPYTSKPYTVPQPPQATDHFLDNRFSTVAITFRLILACDWFCNKSKNWKKGWWCKTPGVLCMNSSIMTI